MDDIIVGVIIGVVVTLWFLNWITGRLEQRILNSIKDLEETKSIGLDVEVDGNQFFCYNSETKDFICQGADVHEIRQRFKARFPGHNAYLNQGNPEVIAKLKQQLKGIKNNEDSISI